MPALSYSTLCQYRTEQYLGRAVRMLQTLRELLVLTKHLLFQSFLLL